MKILTILGTRPQFIKAGSVSREILKQREAGVDSSQLDLYGNGKAFQRIISELLND